MTLTRTMTGLLVSAFLLASCSIFDSGRESSVSGTQKASVAEVPPFPETDLWLEKNSLVVNAGHAKAVAEYERAFSQGAVIAYGEGLPTAGAEGAGQKRLTAQRAAEVEAQRNLAEYFARYAKEGEIRFDSRTVRMEAFLKGAVIASSEYNPDREKAVVLMKLDLRGFKGFAR